MGQVIGMCPDFPVEQVAAESIGEKDSDQELIEELNRIYANAELPTRFRRAKPAEYHYADTAGGSEPKVADKAHLAQLGLFTPHIDNSYQSALDGAQTRSIRENAPNSLGFRRSGVWEWADEMDYSRREVVGGSWHCQPSMTASGSRMSFSPNNRLFNTGPSRLVRTNP